MFTLARKYSFQPDPVESCLSASYGYGEELRWELVLESERQLTHYPSESGPSSFGINVHPPLGLVNWRTLSGRSFQVSEDDLSCAFSFYFDSWRQWEPLTDLHLQFGQVRGTSIEVTAEGHGRTESAEDLLLTDEVHFKIQTQVRFTGIALLVPLNAGDPLAYSAAKVQSLMPGYAYSQPTTRETRNDDGVVQFIETHFAPSE